MGIKNDSKRTIRRQIMVTPEMDEKILNDARRFGLSVSSYLELIIGRHFSKKNSQTLIDDKVV